MSGITAEENKAEVFDTAIGDICSTHWKNVSFQWLSLYPYTHLSVVMTSLLSIVTTKMCMFLTCPLRDIQSGKYNEC